MNKILMLVAWATMVLLSKPNVAHSQDFLKQLENRLRDATKTAEPPSETESEPEELPLATPKPGAPIVITPKKQPRSSPPAFQLPSVEVEQLPNGQSEPSIPGGFLGLTLEPVEGGGFGLAVVEVAMQSPAWKAGFREGDRVIGIGGQAVSAINQFADELERFSPGTPVKFLVQRRGRSLTLTAVLQDRGLANQLQGIPAGSMPPQSAASPYQPISEDLIAEGGLVLGVSVSDLSEAFRRQFGIPVPRGAAISEVVVGSSAELSGMRPGDCIVDIDGRRIQYADEVLEATQSARLGQSLTIGYYRGRQKLVAEVPLYPSDARRRNSASGLNVPNESMTPEYVARLQEELARLQDEVSAMQGRIRELEARLQQTRR